MKLVEIKKHFWSFAIVAGFSVSLIVTLIIVTWEWLENPGGIFHGQNGTNWSFIYDTGISWFLPTFANVTLIAAIGHLIFSGFKWYRKNRSKRQT